MSMRNNDMFLSPSEVDHQRLRNFAAVFGRVDSTLAGREIETRLLDAGSTGAPAWSDGERITFNTDRVGDVTDTHNLVSLMGLNYHELCHLLWTPRSNTTWMQQVGKNGLFPAFNILEDQRIETLITAKYGATKSYLKATFLEHSLNIQSADYETLHFLSWGRKHLGVEIRKMLADSFKRPDLLPKVNAIIDEYRVMGAIEGRNARRAYDLIEQFHHLLVEVGTPSDTNCSSTGQQTGGHVELQEQNDAASKAQQKAKEEKKEDDEHIASNSKSSNDGTKNADKTDSEDDDEPQETSTGARSGDESDVDDDTDADDGDAEGADGSDEEDDEQSTSDGSDSSSGDSDSDDGSEDDSVRDQSESEDSADDDWDADDDEEASSPSSSSSDQGDGSDSSSSDVHGEGQGGSDQAGDGGEGSGSPSDGGAGDPNSSGSSEDAGTGGTSAGNGDGTGSRDLTPEEIQEIAEAIGEALQEAMDNSQSSIKAVQDNIVRPNGSRIPPVELQKFGGSGYPCTPDMIGESRRVGNEFRRLVNDSDPGWNTHRDSGRINVRRAMHSDNYDDVFDQWNEGNQLASDMEVVIALDVSSSMNGIHIPASKALWVVRRAIESIGPTSRVTTFAFNSNSYIMTQPGEKAEASRFEVYHPSGGTNPAMALTEARRIFQQSQKAHKIMIAITDGEWGAGIPYGVDPTSVVQSEESIDIMNKAGVLTGVLLIANEMLTRRNAGLSADAIREKYSHGSQVFEASSDVNSIKNFSKKVVTLAMRKVR